MCRRHSLTKNQWEARDGDTGHIIAQELYHDDGFKYLAPLPPAADVLASQYETHKQCEKLARASDLPEEFVEGFQTRISEFMLTGDDGAALERLREELYRRQHPADCKTARILLYPQNQDCGMGAEIHWMQMALTAAFESDRVLAMREDQVSRCLLLGPTLKATNARCTGMDFCRPGVLRRKVVFVLL